MYFGAFSYVLVLSCFVFNNCIYLLILFLAVLGLQCFRLSLVVVSRDLLSSCDVQASHCDGFSLKTKTKTRVFIYLAALGLSFDIRTLSCGMWDLVP